MFCFALKLVKRDSLTFLLLNVLRVLVIVACILVIAGETQRMVRDVNAFKQPVPTSSAQASPATATATAKASSVVLGTAAKATSAVGGLFSGINSNARLVRRAAEALLTAKECGYVPNSSVPDQLGGVVFSVASAITDILLLLLILVAESGLPFVSKFLIAVVPVFGPEQGLGWLGFFELFLAVTVLSRRLTVFGIVASWFLLIVGALNVLLGLVYGAAAREMRALRPSEGSPIGKLSSRIRGKGEDVEMHGSPSSGKGPRVINISAPMPAPPYRPAQSMQEVGSGLRSVFR